MNASREIIFMLRKIFDERKKINIKLYDLTFLVYEFIKSFQVIETLTESSDDDTFVTNIRKNESLGLKRSFKQVKEIFEFDDI